MAKVHPKEVLSSSFHMNSRREVFTVWMKSLIMNSNGCTIFDSNGELVYRVDNYDRKCSDEVCLMDSKGKTLCSIVRKKLRLFGRWEGFKSNTSTPDNDHETTRPWFQVRKSCKKAKCYEVHVRQNMNKKDKYILEGLDGKLSCRIEHQEMVIAEMKQKQSSSGVSLGEDATVVDKVKEHRPSLRSPPVNSRNEKDAKDGTSASPSTTAAAGPSQRLRHNPQGNA
ncbi:hypothetical protein Sjap_012028 [Stephania japonica]|uniref:Protein LURP-one-related 4 n=1 Tax=Stephania japonica TaxID=461633 RepID=A0AAP0JCE5_9MAGN